MRRLFVVVALVAAMVLGSASAALAVWVQGTDYTAVGCSGKKFAIQLQVKSTAAGTSMNIFTRKFEWSVGFWPQKAWSNTNDTTVLSDGVWRTVATHFTGYSGGSAALNVNDPRVEVAWFDEGPTSVRANHFCY